MKPLFVLAIALFGFAPAVVAVPITYMFTGTGTGTVGSTQFTNAAYTITLKGDTCSVQPDASNPVNGIAINAIFAATMAIAGIGVATITGRPEINDARGVNSAIVVRSQGDFDFMDGRHPAFATYLLTTNIGPISGIIPFGLHSAPSLSSTLGRIAMSDSTPFTFQATVMDGFAGPCMTATAVPTIDALGVLLLAVLTSAVSVFEWRRRFRRATM